MAAFYGKLAACIAVFFLVACGNNTLNTDTPPPLASDYFSGVYKVVNRIDADSMLFYNIHKENVQYIVERHTYIVKDSSLHSRAGNEIFKLESDHRIIANGGQASISYMPQDSLLWYVNKPNDFKLKKIGEYSAETATPTGLFILLKQKKIIGR